MCLIIVSPKGHDIKKSVTHSAMYNNPDGVGIMFDGKAEKYLTPSAEFIHSRLLELCDKKVAVHFRQATHGDIDHANTHPYALPGGAYLMHNGILPCGNKADKSKSDTWHYIKLHLSGRKIDWKNVQLDRHNKFVIMDKKGNFDIVNENTGVDYEGAWYSNTYAWDYPRRPRFIKGYKKRVYTPGKLESSVISLLEMAERIGLIDLLDDPYEMSTDDLSDALFEIEVAIS
jgi:hypothetical protein